MKFKITQADLCIPDKNLFKEGKWGLEYLHHDLYIVKRPSLSLVNKYYLVFNKYYSGYSLQSKGQASCVWDSMCLIFLVKSHTLIATEALAMKDVSCLHFCHSFSPSLSVLIGNPEYKLHHMPEDEDYNITHILIARVQD